MRLAYCGTHKSPRTRPIERSKAAPEFLWFSDSYGSRSKLTDSRSLVNVRLLQHGRTGRLQHHVAWLRCCLTSSVKYPSLLARDEDPELVIWRRVVAAVSLVGEDDLNRAALADSKSSQREAVLTSDMKRESPYSFGRIAFALPEMEVNKAAYWDYRESGSPISAWGVGSARRR
jgi:hypothetical protein